MDKFVICMTVVAFFLIPSVEAANSTQPKEYNLDKRPEWSIKYNGQISYPHVNTQANKAVEAYLGSPYRALDYPKVNYTEKFPRSLVDKGQYLAYVGDCISCHTDSTQKKPAAFAGGFPMPLKPFGTFFTPNITPDKLTGIGKWSFDDFDQAVRNGHSVKYGNMYPVMPYLYYTKVTPDDMKALYAYFQSITAVDKKKIPDQLIFPANIRFSLYGWKMLFFYPDRGVYKYNKEKSQVWNRGAYLTEGLGHCSMCHTPYTSLIVAPSGAPNMSKYLQGNMIDYVYFAPDISSSALTGYSPKEIVDLFKKGILLGGGGRAIGPMSEVNHNSLQRLKEQDLLAIATYLKTVRGRKLDVKLNSFTKNDAKTIYNSICTDCHEKRYMGAPRLGDQADWKYRLETQGRKKLYTHTWFGYNQMPARGTCMRCSFDQVRYVVDYILNKSTQGYAFPKDIMIPTAPVPAMAQANGEKVFNAVCATCHANTNQMTVAQKGDTVYWAEEIKSKEVGQLINNVLSGKNGHPLKGQCAWCSGTQVVAAVKYLLNNSVENKDYTLW